MWWRHTPLKTSAEVAGIKLVVAIRTKRSHLPFFPLFLCASFAANIRVGFLGSNCCFFAPGSVEVFEAIELFGSIVAGSFGAEVVDELCGSSVACESAAAHGFAPLLWPIPVCSLYWCAM